MCSLPRTHDMLFAENTFFAKKKCKFLAENKTLKTFPRARYWKGRKKNAANLFLHLARWVFRKIWLVGINSSYLIGANGWEGTRSLYGTNLLRILRFGTSELGWDCCLSFTSEDYAYVFFGENMKVEKKVWKVTLLLPFLPCRTKSGQKHSILFFFANFDISWGAVTRFEDNERWSELMNGSLTHCCARCYRWRVLTVSACVCETTRRQKTVKNDCATDNRGVSIVGREGEIN